MFTLISTLTRPNTSAPWWYDAPALSTEASLLRTFTTDPLVTSFTSEESSDGLTVTRSFTYDSYSDYQAWTAKILETNNLVFLKRNDYIIENGMTLKIEEVFENGSRVVEKQL